jgi:uncharacterized protein (TIGR03437 family)
MNGADVNTPGSQCTIGPPATPCVQYSGLNYFPGVWQINVQIPNTVVPGANPGVPAPAVALTVKLNGLFNTDAGGFKTVIAVK